MAPLPKRRHSTRRQGRRRFETTKNVNHSEICSQCGTMKLSHTACAKCGYYSETVKIPVKTVKTPKS